MTDEQKDEYFDRAVVALASLSMKLSFGSATAAVLLLAECIAALEISNIDAGSNAASKQIIESLRALNPEAFLPRAASVAN